MREILYFIDSSEINMWNQFLEEAQSDRKYENTPLLILGKKHSGKRSLVDSLFDVSKTTLYSKRQNPQLASVKMKLKGLVPILDYAYLNVLDLSDPDYRTHSKLQVYMIEDSQNPNIYSQLENPDILRRALVIIMLDYTNPWNFMEELGNWVRFLQQLQLKAGLNIVELQKMAKSVQKSYMKYKQPQFDETGKLKKNFNEEQDIDLPLPEDVLQNNLRLPLIVCVNKCDLQSSVLRDESENKISFVLYHLRKFCLNYGAALIYTSLKNNTNLEVLYEYILHRSYNMSMKYKPELINEEAIFIPLGFDTPNMLNDSTLKLDVSRPYLEVITAPSSKKMTKEEITVEEDSEFFKKYYGGTSITTSAISINETSGPSEESFTNGTVPKEKATEATSFFLKLLGSSNAQNSSNGQSEKQKREKEAQNSLLKHTVKQMNLNKSIKTKE